MKKSSAFAAIAASIVAMLALSAPALADPQPLAQIEQRVEQPMNAQLIRGRALNQQYHLGTYAMAPPSVAAEERGLALNEKYGNAWTKMSSAQFSALVRFFGNDITQHSPAQLRASSPGGHGFDWRDFGIGIAAALAAILAVGAARRGTRRRHSKASTAQRRPHHLGGAAGAAPPNPSHIDAGRCVTTHR